MYILIYRNLQPSATISSKNDFVFTANQIFKMSNITKMCFVDSIVVFVVKQHIHSSGLSIIKLFSS